MKSVIGKKKTSFQKKYYFMINNERIENDIRISNEFNNYFVSVRSVLASKINVNSCNPLDYIQSNVQSMAIPNYYENDVTLAINSLKNSSPGWDNIPTLIAKHVIHCYIKPLVFLINQSLIEGVFPDELKLAKVIPVFKAGSSMELSNYRPISVQFFFQKSMKNLCITPWYLSLIYIISFIKINLVFVKDILVTMLLLLWLTKLLNHLIQETW